MAGVVHKAMVWLGLAPDDEYDDYPYDPGMRSANLPPQQMGGRPAPAPRGPGPGGRPPAGRPGPGRPGMPQDPRQQGRQGMPGYDDEGYVTPHPQHQQPNRQSGSVRPLPQQGGQQSRPMPNEENPTVRPMRPTTAKPAEIAPASFEEAKNVADYFKAAQPVVMDLAGADRDLSRRLVDFASGVCYALGGSMERVRAGGYLLTPPGVEVSDDDRRRLSSQR